jgi:hypothetical protein
MRSFVIGSLLVILDDRLNLIYKLIYSYHERNLSAEINRV